MLHPIRAPAPIACLCALLSTGCAVAPAPPVLPPALLSCRDAPEPPAAGAGDVALGVWIVDLAEAGEDCRARLREVRGVVGR